MRSCKNNEQVFFLKPATVAFLQLKNKKKENTKKQLRNFDLYLEDFST